MRGAAVREFRALFRLAAPLAAAQAGTQLMGLVDVAVLGRLGAVEIAGAGLSNAVFFAFSIMAMGLVMGVDPLMSQAIGARNPARARHVLWQGLWLSMCVAAGLTVILLAAAMLLPYIGAKPEIVRPAQTYLLVRVTGIVPFLAFFAVRSYLQAIGKTAPLLVSMIAANVFNLGADILLVFGGKVLPSWAGPLRNIPALGVAGAAIATVLCTILQLSIIAWAVRSVRISEPVSMRWNREEIGRATRIGLPLALQMGAEVGIFALVGVLAARLGTMEIASHQLVIGLASFTFTVAVGVASAAAVRVGLGVGARNTPAARMSGRVAFVGGTVFMALSGLAFALFPRAIARLVTDQENVIAAALPLMLVAAVFQLSDGIQAVGAGVLRGAGDTKYAFYANLVGHWAIGFPVALWLGFRAGLGIVGLWWGLCAGLTVVAVLLFVRFEKLSRTEIVPL